MRWRMMKPAAAAVGAMTLAGGFGLSPLGAQALSGNTGQSEQLAVAGGVSIALSNNVVDFGTVVAGNSTVVGVGDVKFINTTGDGQAWSATVAATDLSISTTGTTATTCNAPDGCISFTHEYFHCDASGTTGPGNCTLTPSGPSFQNPPVNFSGADAQPGASFSDPVTILSGQPTDQGSFVMSGAQVELRVPADAQPASSDPTREYHGTLQYTITG